ncbi:MAG: cupin domain-containing protein [Halobacteriales archaeon]
MERVALEDVDPTAFGQGVFRRALSEPLATEAMAVNHYRVPPGEELPSGLHTHLDQEELFLVLAGEATFETLQASAVTVEAGAAIRFAPGDYQSGRNDGAVELELVAIGAPRRTADTRVPFDCPACGVRGLRLDAGDDGLVFTCPACAGVQQPAPCPACDADDLRATLAETGEPVTACRNCGASYDAPPLAD